MAQSSPEGIILGKGSTLVKMEVSVNEEPILEVGKDTADYIDKHIVAAMVEVAKQKIHSDVFKWLSDKDYLSDKVDIIQKEFEQFINK
jgi:hypothetical protein